MVPLMECVGHRVSEEIRAVDPFPPFPASMMDGYAVCAPIEAGVYEVLASRIHAGDDVSSSSTSPSSSSPAVLQPNQVAYITTGAMLPPGANAVVKIEDTESPGLNGGGGAREKGDAFGKVETAVNIKVSVSKEGVNVRQIGSDMQVGELLLQTGQVIGPAEVGLLATVGVTHVPCYGKPIVGVLSTGNELVDPWQAPHGSQIRDSNRAALMAAFIEEGYTCIDLGIVKDAASELRARLQDAASRCDVVITSGGVSMGDADLVKPMLEELGEIHFGRINMKPGKPTTFATIVRNQAAKKASGKAVGGGGRQQQQNVLFFGLPGNPVSCLVTKALFVDPAMRRLQGASSTQCLHTQLEATVVGEAPLALDPERPEYHRAILTFDAADGSKALVKSTGFQRSSRLLSMGSSNALIYLPQGTGSVQVGARVSVLLSRPLIAPPTNGAISLHQAAALLDESSSSSSSSSSGSGSGSGSSGGDGGGNLYESFSSVMSKQHPSSAIAAASEAAAGTSSKKKAIMRVALLTISDRASSGVYADESGPEMARLLLAMHNDPDWALQVDIVKAFIVPDEPALIRKFIVEWVDNKLVDLLLTSGGTGFGPRDLTPEAIRPLLHREAPGIAQALINEGLKHTPLAVLSRPVAGTRHETLICTLPGSVKAVRENIAALKVLLPRIIELLQEGTCTA